MVSIAVLAAVLALSVYEAASSPRRAIALIRSAVRQAIAWIVSDGLTPPTVGNTEPSQIHKLGMSQQRQSALTTLLGHSQFVDLRWLGVSHCRRGQPIAHDPGHRLPYGGSDQGDGAAR